MSGQSYNPSAKAHKDLLTKVVEVEKTQLEQEEATKKALFPHLFAMADDQDEAEEGAPKAEQPDSDEDVLVDELVNPTVDRKKKKT